MEEVIMATLPNKELNRLIKIEIAVENLIENGVLDEDLFNEYLRELQNRKVYQWCKNLNKNKLQKLKANA